MMGAARTFGTSFDELSDGDGIAFSFGTHLQVKSESPAIIGNRIPLQERGGQASRPAQVSHVSHVSGGFRRAGQPR